MLLKFTATLIGDILLLSAKVGGSTLICMYFKFICKCRWKFPATFFYESVNIDDIMLFFSSTTSVQPGLTRSAEFLRPGSLMGAAFLQPGSLRPAAWVNKGCRISAAWVIEGCRISAAWVFEGCRISAAWVNKGC